MRVLVSLAVVLAAFAAAPPMAVAREPSGAVLAHRSRAKRAVRLIAADLERRGSTAWDGATSEPQGGLTKDGNCDDASRALRVGVFIPPPGSADMFTDIGFVCRSTKQYWVHRTGGFIATDVWVGPFDLRPRRAHRR